MQGISASGLNSHWIDAITWIFVLVNTGRLLAYLPQFISAWNCPYGARSVSILTWSYFTFAHCTALMYALLVLHDSKSVWIFAGNLGVTLCLVTLLLWKRWTFIRAARRSISTSDSEVSDDSNAMELARDEDVSNEKCSMTTQFRHPGRRDAVLLVPRLVQLFSRKPMEAIG